jgi:hypothetical protein
MTNVNYLLKTFSRSCREFFFLRYVNSIILGGRGAEIVCYMTATLHLHFLKKRVGCKLTKNLLRLALEGRLVSMFPFSKLCKLRVAILSLRFHLNCKLLSIFFTLLFLHVKRYTLKWPQNQFLTFKYGHKKLLIETRYYCIHRYDFTPWSILP